MPRALLLTMTALTCFAVALGCERNALAHQRERKALDHQRERKAPPISAEPEPAMSTPAIEDVVETPALTREPMPAPAAPSRPPSPYQDPCGRPLVA